MSHSASQPAQSHAKALNGPCPTCEQGGGFHDAQIHAAFPIDSIHFKEKDWHKNERARKGDAGQARN